MKIKDKDLLHLLYRTLAITGIEEEQEFNTWVKNSTKDDIMSALEEYLSEEYDPYGILERMEELK